MLMTDYQEMRDKELTGAGFSYANKSSGFFYNSVGHKINVY